MTAEAKRVRHGDPHVPLLGRVWHVAETARRIGPITHRHSPGVEGGYTSNGCVECDALLGRFALEDLLREHLAGGGTYGQLDIGIPVERPAVASLRRAAHG